MGSCADHQQIGNRRKGFAPKHEGLGVWIDTTDDPRRRALKQKSGIAKHGFLPAAPFQGPVVIFPSGALLIASLKLYPNPR